MTRRDTPRHRPGEPVVLRSPRRPVLVGLLVVAAAVALVVGVVGALVGVPLAALLAAQAWAQSRTAVELHRDHARVRVGFFSRRVPWRDVGEVVRQRALGVERVVLVTPRAQYRLPVPSTGPFGSGPQYEEHARLVERSWRAGATLGP